MGILTAIHGQIGSGKDTVALMSVLLHYHIVDIGNFPDIDDFKRAEKTQYRSTRYGVEIKKFATSLRKVAEILTGIDHWRFEDRDFKENFYRNNLTGEIRQRNELPNGAIAVENWQKEGYEENSWIKIRVYLQDLGTDAIRRRDEHAWVNALFSKYNPKKDIWAISDMRFPNEFDRVKKENGYTIKVVRPETDRTDYENMHPSETALLNRDFDITIINDGSLEDLLKKVHIELTKINFYDDKGKY